MSRSRQVPVLAALVLAGAALASPASAPAGEANPLPRWLESLQVAPAAEFRLVVVHPVFAPVPDEGTRVPAFAATAPAASLGVPASPKGGRSVVRIENFGKDPVWALPGDVLRLGDADYAVRSDVVTAGAAAGDVPVVRISSMAEHEKPREEPRALGAIPGPALLWMLVEGTREKAMVGTAEDLAKECGLATPRRSAAELSRGEKIAARVREYRSRLATLPRPSAAGKREMAGYAVVLDGGFAALEVFPDGKRFQEAWPSRLEGIAVEAAIAELENGVLETDLAAPTDPDRFTADVKDAMLELYGLSPDPSKLPGLGQVLALRNSRTAGRVVVAEKSGPQHLLWLRDPAQRRTSKSPEEPDYDPGVIDRKFRPTEAEKRWRERREQRNPPPPGK